MDTKMDSLISFDGFSDVANNLIDKLSTAVNWVATRETPNKVAINTYIKEIQESDYDPLTKAALISNAKKTIREYTNQAQIVQKAIPLLTENGNPKELDEDWLNEFMDKARLVSDEEFQMIWARILAGEIESKNSFSIRTLEKVKNLSKKEAEMFSKVAKLALGSYERKYIIDDKTLNQKHGVNLEDIIILEECGFMSAQTLSLTTTITGNVPRIFEDDGVIVAMLRSKDGSQVEVSRSIYTFTKSGKELLDALSINHDESYLLDVLKMLKNKNAKKLNLELTAHKILERNGEKLRYENKDLLTVTDANNESNQNT